VSILVHDERRDDRAVRVPLEVVHEGGETSRREPRVGIQQQDVRRRCRPNSDVGGRRKAEIPLDASQANVAGPTIRRTLAAIERAVIDDHRIPCKPGAAGCERRQATREVRS
jgi:hypothetical protein